MGRLSDNPRTPADDKHGSLSIEAFQRYEKRKKLERDIRLLQLDIEYKKALGLEAGQALPKAIGTAGGTRTPMSSGLRGSKRLA